MTDFGNHSPRRYFVDHHGRRVLIGLSTQETSEFENLDGRPTPENRWLELYSKHEAAWRRWVAETGAGRSRSLRFINQDGVI
jgi:hypothetical protein